MNVERRTRSEERVDKKAIVSVRVSEVACPGGPSRRHRSQCKRDRRLHRRCQCWRSGAGLLASAGTQTRGTSGNDNGS
ncbi:unnamed protein product [Lasius platythorax]|uniref:Uncharacterized protein n=1 Tax=Lasius platythorax TaxID=488582 RepID=A0AAV2N603_9HYME